ncbi:Cullin family-domain-containing protein [Parasitella parasitica]|nr:Cullin family-domain-containing protein [Parasitella parasitica]
MGSPVDPTQKRLDRFLSAASPSPSSSPGPSSLMPNEPMQIDSAAPRKAKKHMLGTYRQQIILPKITIADVDPTRQVELTDSNFENYWAMPKKLILSIFSTDNFNRINFITASQISIGLCRFGKSEKVYNCLKEEIEKHVQEIKKSLHSKPLNQDILGRLNAHWDTFCLQLGIIRTVFMELDRHYILPNTKHKSIMQLGKDLFSEVIMETDNFLHVVIAEVLHQIKIDRDRIKSINTKLLQDILRMLTEQSYYKSEFEPRFLESTNLYYREEANRRIGYGTIPDYIHHAAGRRTQEAEERIKNYLNADTKQALISAVVDKLVYAKTEVIIEKGFHEMMDRDMYEPLKVFYELLYQSPKINILRSAFGEYLKEEGTKIVKDPKNDPTMITSLVLFKRKIDGILKHCFNDNVVFLNALKESFEQFINTRGNKPAELLAKHLDSKLKIPVKKQRLQEIVDTISLDSILVLFRFIRSKDAFEAYFKRFLAKRLLMDRSTSGELENHVLVNLKSECGAEFTKDLENMFTDIQISTDLTNEFKEYKKEKPRLPMSIKVIAQAIWPTYNPLNIKLPSNMIASQKLFEDFYAKKFNGRKLLWQNRLSSCSIIANFPKGRKEVIASLAQAVLLFIFNDSTKKSMTFTKLQTLTALSDSDLVGLLVSLSTGPYKLLLNTSGSDKVNQSDSFTYNHDFESANQKVRIPAAASIEPAKDEEKDVEKKVHISRQHQLEAAIVRIMKARKTSTHTALVEDLFNELKCPVQAEDIKKRIEILIDRDYIILFYTDEWTKINNCDEYDVWPLIADDLSARLPLRNLKWQPSSQRAECLIPILEVDLKRFTVDYTPQPLSTTQTTYLNLYFVSCEDSELYKTNVKRNIRHWVEMIQAKKNQEWLIVYVADTEAKRANNYLGLKASVYDKIRTDFNPPKQDRFDLQVLQIQEDTRRLDMQRHMPGWNYCTFFILKEGLAQAFEIMTLHEDALIQYDELEASFFQVLRDKALAWFGHFGGTDPGDDSGNILDFKRKNYRDLINKNIISVFDFRSYLFARQCRMLLKLQRVIEVTARAQLFITNFIPSIRENEEHLPENFVESWIGVKCGHLPMTDPFSIYISRTDPYKPLDSDEPKKLITNGKLLEAIESVDAFDKTYMGLSTRAIKSYDASFRSRAALNVHGDIAALKYIREKYEEAVRIYESMIWRYGEHEWSAIENSLLIKCADSQRRLGKADQYVESLLALLKNSKCLEEQEASDYTDEMIANVAKLDKEIKRPFQPIFSISVIAIIDDASSVEGTSVEICLDNHLPKKIHYDSISLRLVGSDPEQISFTIQDQDLEPGKNTFLLTSETSTSGNYVVETCEMRIGKLVFSHNFLRPGQKKRVVRLNHDMNQLHATLSQPHEICLGEKQRLSVKIDSRSCSTTLGVLLLESQTEGMEIVRVSKVSAIIDAERGIELDMLETGEIVLPDLKPNESIELFVVYEGSFTEYDYRIKTTITYKMNDKSHKFVSSDYVKVTVPLLVTESTIFRETCVFLKVELSCNGDLPVRILGSFAKPSTYYLVESNSEMKQCALTLFPRQTVSFIYKLVKRKDKLATDGDNVENSLQIMLKNKLQELNLQQHLPYVFQKVKEAFLGSVDYSSYGLTDVVHLDDFDVELCESFLLHRDLKTKVQLLDAIEEFFEKNEAITVHQIQQIWPNPELHSIAFPLEVPTTKITHTAELVLSVEKDLIVSEACPCTLRIKQLTYWNPDKSKRDFYYDVDVDYDNWLLSGKRRLRFVSNPDEAMEFPFSLVPLKTGNLLLPSVRVSAVSADIFASTVYVNSAQQILVKPKSKTATFFVEQQQRFIQPAANPSLYASLPIAVDNRSVASGSIRSGTNTPTF